jgi:hypothetical protein
MSPPKDPLTPNKTMLITRIDLENMKLTPKMHFHLALALSNLSEMTLF